VEACRVAARQDIPCIPPSTARTPTLREPLTIKLLWATLGLILLTLLPGEVQVQLVQWPLDLAAMAAGSTQAVLGRFMPWQLVTHPLVNPSVLTLILWVAPMLYFSGGQLEGMWGARRYGYFLLACTLVPAVVVLLVTSLARWAGLGEHPAAGVSGPIYGILFALAYIAPYQQVRLMLPPVEMQMRTISIVFGVLNFVFGVQQQGLWAHLGFLAAIPAAWLHIRYWRGLPPFGRKPPPAKKKPHLRVV
jgi:membrane associated rhomboid family serine protease